MRVAHNPVAKTREKSLHPPYYGSLGTSVIFGQKSFVCLFVCFFGEVVEVLLKQGAPEKQETKNGTGIPLPWRISRHLS